MVPCRAVVEYEKEITYGTNDNITTKKVKDTRRCGCKSETFYQVEYDKLHEYRGRETKFSDIFGFCSGHAKDFEKPKAYLSDHYGRRSRVYGLRGKVTSVTLITDPNFNSDHARQDEIRSVMAGFKANIKRTMGQKNARKLTLNDWRQAFDELIDEYVVETIHNS